MARLSLPPHVYSKPSAHVGTHTGLSYTCTCSQGNISKIRVRGYADGAHYGLLPVNNTLHQLKESTKKKKKIVSAPHVKHLPHNTPLLCSFTHEVRRYGVIRDPLTVFSLLRAIGGKWNAIFLKCSLSQRLSNAQYGIKAYEYRVTCTDMLAVSLVGILLHNPVHFKDSCWLRYIQSAALGQTQEKAFLTSVTHQSLRKIAI